MEHSSACAGGSNLYPENQVFSSESRIYDGGLNLAPEISKLNVGVWEMVGDCFITTQTSFIYIYTPLPIPHCDDQVLPNGHFSLNSVFVDLNVD